MKHKSQAGFAHVAAILLVVVVVGAIGGSGYYVYHKNHTAKKAGSVSASDEYKEGVITIKQVSRIGEANKQAMLTKVIRPFVYYQDNELKLPVTDVVVTISKSPTTGQPDSKFGYHLSYNQKGSSIALGFTFGDSGKINYWTPQLCGGGCRPYPESFKAKYPANYQAYVNSLGAKSTSATSVNTTNFAELPNDLKRAVLANAACASNGQLMTEGGSADTNKDQYYVANAAAFIKQCQAVAFYAYDGNEWQHIGDTQFGFNCSTLVQHDVPKALIAAALPNGQCLDSSGKFVDYK